MYQAKAKLEKKNIRNEAYDKYFLNLKYLSYQIVAHYGLDNERML